jgi:hypothetical protein
MEVEWKLNGIFRRDMATWRKFEAFAGDFPVKTTYRIFQLAHVGKHRRVFRDFRPQNNNF